ncbi:M23 family metallopeptidase [Streptomyces sp. BI20]|uniref:M23 family metallopeptidase n=1 Tax=Streptomyces sp. BI20 TaxID=3403460 RepID=UPI003C7217D0
MNDHPSPSRYPDTGYDGYEDLSAGGHDTQGQGWARAPHPDPYGPGADQATGSWDSTAWTGGLPPDAGLGAIPGQHVPEDTTGQWNASAWNTSHEAGAFVPDPASGDHTGGGQWAMPTPMPGGVADGGSGTWDSTAWAAPAAPEATQVWGEPLVPAPAGEWAHPATAVIPQYQEQYQEQYQDPSQDPYQEQRYWDGGPESHQERFAQAETAVFAPVPDAPAAHEVHDPYAPYAPAPEGPDEEFDPHSAATRTMPAQAPAPDAPAGRAAARRAAGRSGGPAGRSGSSRRGATSPAKRSALLTVAVPSACVMGVAGVAAASVGGLTGGPEKPAPDTTTMAAPDTNPVPVAANSRLDTQLAALSADAGDFAERAGRTQERIDLRKREADERKKREEEAARKEALRPKFALPVAQHGLSAGYGQSGINWMSLHTGIDFPVAYGTPVMAATDGTVRTQWNNAYGNMVMLTSPDGTETWYCHLGSYKIRSGKVKAGDVIAYSGNSGNSTGPHLHFEVRPGSGSPVDPAAWLRSKGFDPS